MNSYHYSHDRKERDTLIREKIGYGEVVTVFRIDNHRVEGPELHKVTSTGLVMIYNEITNKLVTVLIARPGQLSRYYGKGKVPAYLWTLALNHQRKGYNQF